MQPATRLRPSSGRSSMEYRGSPVPLHPDISESAHISRKSPFSFEIVVFVPSSMVSEDIDVFREIFPDFRSCWLVPGDMPRFRKISTWFRKISLRFGGYTVILKRAPMSRVRDADATVDGPPLSTLDVGTTYLGGDVTEYSRRDRRSNQKLRATIAVCSGTCTQVLVRVEAVLGAGGAPPAFGSVHTIRRSVAQYPVPHPP